MIARSARAANSTERGVVCPWCATTYMHHQSHCTTCGGQIPLRSHLSAGEPPPPPPRTLPAEFVRRIKKSASFETIFGAIFGGVGVLIGLIFVPVGITTGLLLFIGMGLLFTLIFGGIGFAVLAFGRRRVDRALAALERGTTVIGRIESVELDESVSVNQRHPWSVVYTFVANGTRQMGSQRAWHPDEETQAGAPVYVVYTPEDPGNSSLWPPVA
jgi:hypothetical protein